LGKRKVALTPGEEWEEALAVVVAGLDQLEAVSVAVASMQQRRRSVVRAGPLEWERAEAELASAYRATLQLERVRYIGGLSIIMDKSAGP
jgi:hypothetical protein